MSLSVTQTQPDLDTFASREHGQWTLIPQQEVDDWNRRLVATDAHFRQYPYWHEPYRQIGARVYYLVYKVDAIPIFYAAMVLRGMFLGSAAEVEWYVSGIRRFFPEAWADFAGDAGESIIGHYRQLIDHPDTSVALAAARRWCDYEACVMAIGKTSNGGNGGRNVATAEELLAGARIQLHFLAHQCFLRPNQLLDDLWRIGNIPITLVQGRMDMVCPPISAFEVARRLAGADLRLVPDGGHSAMQPAIAAELCAATARMRDLLGGSR